MTVAYGLSAKTHLHLASSPCTVAVAYGILAAKMRSRQDP
jgi:hypothetical protein